MLLVTDFDGTVTRRDFFHLVVEAFAPAHLEVYWEGYRDGRLTHFEALAGIFAGIRASEAEMEALLERAEPDPELAAWVARLRAAGWEIVVASAGCEWYIRRILSRAGVNLPVHANPGTFTPGGGLQMALPVGSPFFSREVGIDKAALVRRGLGQGRVVAFAGDGFPDAEAARLVRPEHRFARHDLAAALDGEGLPYRRFDRWSDVAKELLRLGQASGGYSGGTAEDLRL
jgi:2,3-diketo-5-methylthio-1-phosphopentane phosphatase